jgi:hypothetical protein
MSWQQSWQRSWQRTLYAALMLALLAASRAAGAATDNSLPIPCEDIDSVGTAKMSADGAIALRIRSLWYQPVAERHFVYAPGDPQYDAIKHHLGGIALGQSKPVPPLCGTNSEP